MKYTERAHIISVQVNEFSQRTQQGDQHSELQQQQENQSVTSTAPHPQNTLLDLLPQRETT